MNKHLFPPITLFGHKFAMLHRLQMSMCRSDIRAVGIQPSWFPFLTRLMFENEPATYLVLYGSHSFKTSNEWKNGL